MNNPSRSLLLSVLLIHTCTAMAQIDRKALVERHNVVVDFADTLGALTVGNGKFAYTADATGMQSFPEYYANGIPLGTESEWGWHSFPNTEGFRFSEALKPYNFNRKNSLYAVQGLSGRNQQAVDYFRANPHRLQLGNAGMEITLHDGSPARPRDLQNIHQELDLWTGQISSSFSIEGIPVRVLTCADAASDIVSVKIVSPLLLQQRIRLRFRFPYPTNQFADFGVDYTHASSHRTTVVQHSSAVLFTRRLDDAVYYVEAACNSKVSVSKITGHDYALLPAAATSLEVSILFSAVKPAAGVPGFEATAASSARGWEKFWRSGGAVDFSACTDARAAELERRVVLSQYLTRVQCAGNYPPQETGLTYNSWYGRPHMEMYWWHTAHYALWDRTDLMEKSMQWYFRALGGARAIAARQGYKGARWQKMTDHQGGEAPSSTGSFLIWQQPHIIYQAELIYRNHPSKATLQKYRPLIFATADFMASFASYDPANNRYNLGKGIIPAQECYKPAETFNPPYELAYWKWALQAAQRWRTRLGLKPDAAWRSVIDKLAPLAQKDGVYKAAESVEDSYSPGSKYTIDHPAVLAALSTLPPNGMVDTAVMHRTYDTIGKAWHWEHTWGWDFPMVAMAATRLNQPEDAINALFKEVATNTFLKNGHNYQNKRLTLYLPGNGSLLSAIALMCAGSDNSQINNPGFPKNGKWNVRWEGLKKLP